MTVCEMRSGLSGLRALAGSRTLPRCRRIAKEHSEIEFPVDVDKGQRVRAGIAGAEKQASILDALFLQEGIHQRLGTSIESREVDRFGDDVVLRLVDK